VNCLVTLCSSMTVDGMSAREINAIATSFTDYEPSRPIPW
jgi:hypothetical protein